MWYEDGTPVEPLAPEFSALRAAAEALRARLRGGKRPFAVSQELMHLRHSIDLLEQAFAVIADEFADTDEYELQGSATAIDWIRHQCKMSGHAAAASVCVGEMVPSLPRSSEAMSQGRIGYAHLAQLARTAQALRDSDSAAPFDEQPLAEAEEHSVSRFRHDCYHARHATDAEGFLADHVEQVRWSRLELTPCDDGRLALRGLLDAVGGATLRTALEPLAQRAGKADHRRRERRFADALVELAGHGLAIGSQTVCVVEASPAEIDCLSFGHAIELIGHYSRGAATLYSRHIGITRMGSKERAPGVPGAIAAWSRTARTMACCRTRST